jgi:hypothetical protein
VRDSQVVALVGLELIEGQEFIAAFAEAHACLLLCENMGADLRWFPGYCHAGKVLCLVPKFWNTSVHSNTRPGKNLFFLLRERFYYLY